MGHLIREKQALERLRRRPGATPGGSIPLPEIALAAKGPEDAKGLASHDGKPAGSRAQAAVQPEDPPAAPQPGERGFRLDGVPGNDSDRRFHVAV